MNEELLPIGIESTLEHVQAEIDRVDALFTVPTGSIGYQQANYHPIDEERERYSLRTSLTPPTPEVDRFVSVDSPPIVSENRKPRFSLPELSHSEHFHAGKKNHSPLKFQPSPPTVTDNAEEKSRWRSSVLSIPEHCRPPSSVNSIQREVEQFLPFYTANELSQHTESNDAWVSLFARIYDITSLIDKARGTRIEQQYLDYAGQDISHLFDETTGEPRCLIDSHSDELVSRLENHSLIQSMNLIFWHNDDLLIGYLILHSRWIRIQHSFSRSFPIYTVEVAEEETIGQIARRFLRYNSHCFSYTWRYDGRQLDWRKTLTENEITNEENCPTIILNYNDDLTEDV